MKTTAFLSTALLGASLALSLIPSAQAAPDNRDVVHDKHGQVVKNTFGHCVRTKWVSQNDECGAVEVAQVQKTERRSFTKIAQEERTVYFEFNKTGLMESERRKLDGLADTLKSTKDISGVDVVGYADRIGTTGYNESLSERRAKTVEQYLRERGYLNTTVAKTRWLGESVPVTQCADNLDRSALIACLQKDRRVTVEIKYQETTAK